jgi:carbon-monoxide dehydrogenase medium subunit
MIADPLVRNRATLGGNLANGDPANDGPAIALALGAELVAKGRSGERAIPANRFYKSLYTTDLENDEILIEIRIPAPPARSGGAYRKLKRKTGDFAAAAVAVQLSLNPNGTVAQAGIALTNAGPTPIEAVQAMKFLQANAPDEDVISRTAALTGQAAEPSADRRGSVEYKREMARVLAGRALRAALERARA